METLEPTPMAGLGPHARGGPAGPSTKYNYDSNTHAVETLATANVET
jgi:hypothetical protein